MTDNDDTTFTIKAGDRLPVIRETLFSADGPIPLTDAQVRFRLRRRSTLELVVDAPAATVDAGAGIAEYAWQDGDTDAPGVYEREWELTFAGGKTLTVPNDRRGYPVIIARQIA